MKVMIEIFLPSHFNIHKTFSEKAVPQASHAHAHAHAHAHVQALQLEAFGHGRSDAERKQNEEVSPFVGPRENHGDFE